jgi:hypothetical protein
MSKLKVATFLTLEGVTPAAHAAPFERLRADEGNGNGFAT